MFSLVDLFVAEVISQENFELVLNNKGGTTLPLSLVNWKLAILIPEIRINIFPSGS